MAKTCIICKAPISIETIRFLGLGFFGCSFECHVLFNEELLLINAYLQALVDESQKEFNRKIGG